MLLTALPVVKISVTGNLDCVNGALAVKNYKLQVPSE